MENYLKKRKEHLKKVEWDYFNKSVDVMRPHQERLTYRNFSNEFAARRSELEILEKFLNEVKKRPTQEGE